jgi:hypothetical protein
VRLRFRFKYIYSVVFVIHVKINFRNSIIYSEAAAEAYGLFSRVETRSNLNIIENKIKKRKYVNENELTRVVQKKSSRLSDSIQCNDLGGSI